MAENIEPTRNEAEDVVEEDAPEVVAHSGEDTPWCGVNIHNEA
ncbi:hypothetical protein ACFZB9_07740 [Kitasatospora sp. NPDC008050]